MDDIRTPKGLLCRLGEAFPSPIGMNDGYVELALTNEVARELHRELVHLMAERDRLKGACIVLRGIVHELDPALYAELKSLGLVQ